VAQETERAAGDASPSDETQGPTPRNPNRHQERVKRLIDLGTIVGIAALLFSGVTYFFSQRDQTRSDTRAARTELTDVIGRMNALPRQYGLTSLQNDPEHFAE